MKSSALIIITAFLFGNIFAQKTAQYAGTYSFNWGSKTLNAGFLEIYPESDTSLLFYIENDKGSPSHDNGVGYGRIIKKKDSAVFYKFSQDFFMNCMLCFKFCNGKVIVNTVDGHEECGYGFGVYSNGIYYLKNRKIPKYFIFEKDTIYFGENSLKKWYETNR